MFSLAGTGLRPVLAQDYDDGAETVTTSAVPKAPDCNRFLFGKRCLALAANGGAVFGGGLQDFSIGPALTYYIGPFGGYLITPF